MAAYQTIDGNEYVDLGLSVLWSPIGMGATEEGGISKELYAYGYTQPISGGKQPNYTDPGVEDISGNPRFDAATVHWGAPWRIPTIDEAQEFSANCVHTGYIEKRGGGENSRWTGYWKLTSKKNGRSVIIPMGLQPSGWSDFRVSGKITAPGNILNKRDRLTATHTAVQIMAGMGGYKEVGCMLIPVRGEKKYRFTPSDAYEFVSVRREQLDKELKERTEILDKYAWAQHALDQNGDKPIVEEPGVSLSEHAQRKDLVYARNEAKFCVKQSAYQCAMNSPIALLFPWLAPESTAYFHSKGIKGGTSTEQQKTPVQKSKPAQKSKKVQLPSAIRKKLLHL